MPGAQNWVKILGLAILIRQTSASEMLPGENYASDTIIACKY